MKMRNVDPYILCRNHLLGEHYELHLYIGHMRKKKKVDGYINNNLLEINNLIYRHSEIVIEMLKRGWNHNSPLTMNELPDFNYICKEHINYKIDYNLCLQDTLKCTDCFRRYMDKYG